MGSGTGAKAPPADPLERALPFGVAMGHRLRQVREEIEHTGEQVVWNARLLGLGWERTTLTRIELGQRQLTAAELLVLPLLYGRSLADLLPTEPVALNPDAAVWPEELRSALTDAPDMRPWRLPRLREALDTALGNIRPMLKRLEARFPGTDLITVMEAAGEGWTDETTAKAARRLGVDRQVVAVAAQQLWDRGLAAERDGRLAAAGVASTPRARQAQRGHITRALLDELRPVVDDIQQAPTIESGAADE